MLKFGSIRNLIFLGLLTALRAGLAAPVDVTTLGVIPNDGGDDSAALTAALVNNAELYVPPGTYKLNTTVYVPSNRSIVGAGGEQTKFVLGSDTVAFRVNGTTNVYLALFGIDRPFDNSRDEMIFVYNNASYVRLDSIKTTNQRSRAPSLSFFQTAHCSVRNCTTLDNMRQIFEDGHDQVYGSGITYVFSDDIAIEYNNVSETRNLTMPTNPYFNYFQAGSIQVSSCTNARIEYNTISIAGQGIDAGGTTNTVIRGNYLDNCHSIGIKLVNGSYNQKVVGNYVSRCGLIGISLGPGNTERPIVNCKVDANTIVGTGKGIGQDWWDGYFTGTVPAGIHIDASNIPSGRCHDDIITNNSFYDNSQMVYGYINRPGSYNGYNITASNNVIQSGAAPAVPVFPPAHAVGVPFSVVNATQVAGEGIWNSGDQLSLTRMTLNQGTAAGTDRWSFVADLTTATIVNSIALYGDAAYRIDEAAPGGNVQVEAATNLYGPYSVIGSRNFGADRSTNPFTGGKGKRIQVTPTSARYLRISGGPWDSSFDNNMIISEIMVNPRVVIDNYSPLHNPYYALPNPANAPQGSTFDVGGWWENERVAPTLADAKPQGGVNPLKRLTVTVDLGLYTAPRPTVTAFVLNAFDYDVTLLPKTGVLKASSTDDPNNMDVVVSAFTATLTGNQAKITLPVARVGRYFQLQFLTNQSNSVAEDAQRIGEIDFEGSYVPPAKIENWALYN